MEPIPFSVPNLFFDRIQKEPSDSEEDFWFIFKDSQLLVRADTMEPFQMKDPTLVRSIYMGTYDGRHIHVGEWAQPAPPGAIWADLKTLYSKMDEALYALAGRAAQLILWDQTHQFCGKCGTKMIDRLNERAKECPACKLLAFPKICPVVMVLIEKGDEILLARGPHFAKGMYSILAGFVDPGETLEQCVQREVFEEVGLRIDELKYFGSQSWPFPNSLIIAFTCQWKSGEIKKDPQEIEDAQWFKKGDLPLLPPKLSIARIVIDSFAN